MDQCSKQTNTKQNEQTKKHKKQAQQAKQCQSNVYKNCDQIFLDALLNTQFCSNAENPEKSSLLASEVLLTR